MNDFEQTINKLKIPPNNLEAEQGVIGALMLGASFESVSDIVNPEDFYQPGHRLCFAAMGILGGKNQKIDLISLSEVLDAKKELDHVGGLAYLAELAKNTPSISNVHAYARIVRDRAVQRSILITSQQIAGSVWEDLPTDEKIANAQKAVLALDAGTAVTEALPINDVLHGLLGKIDARHQNPGLLGHATGYADFDKYLKGLKGGHVHVIAGRTSSGKTTLAVNVLENISAGNVPALVFSLEMPSEELAQRMVCSLGRVEVDAIDTGKMSGDQWQRLSNGVTKLKSMPIHICDRPGLNIARIRSIARFQKRINKTGIILIDYIGLIRLPGRQGKPIELGDVSHQIKEMAKELDVPVLLLAQLNRSIDNRADKTPTLSDLRDSGDIEQDADTVTILYRDGKNGNMVTEAYVAKNRHGKVGGFKLVLNGEISRFESHSYADTPVNTPMPAASKHWADDDYDSTGERQ